MTRSANYKFSFFVATSILHITLLEVAKHQLGLQEGDLGGVADAQHEREGEGGRADAVDESLRADVDDEVVMSDAEDPGRRV